MVVRRTLDAGLERSLHEALIGADEDPRGREILDAMKVRRFEDIEDSAYDSIRKIDEWLWRQPSP